MKINFDIQKSLQLCPPKFDNGTKHLKRIVLNRDSVTYSATHQVRVYNVDTKKIPVLRDSFLVNGFLHSEPPPTIMVDPNNPKRYVGLSGWHRNAAAEQAEWESMIYDIVEFDSPKAKRIHMNITNHHKAPFIPVTLNDLVKQIKEAVTNKEITNNDKDVKDFIQIIASDKTENDRETIFKTFRRNISTSSNLLCYLSANTGDSSTGVYAEKYNLPYKGEGRYNQTGRLGYIFSQSTPKTALVESKKLYQKYGKEVEFYAWISNPLEGKGLLDQRTKFLELFNKFIMDDCESIHFFMNQLGYNVSLKEIIDNHPVKFKGFLHQDISPDPFNNGKPKEQGIVDVHGNPVLI